MFVYKRLRKFPSKFGRKFVSLHKMYFAPSVCPIVKRSELHLASKRASSGSCSGVVLTVFLWIKRSRDIINDIPSCANIFVCILYITAMIVVIVRIFMALLHFPRLIYYEIAGILLLYGRHWRFWDVANIWRMTVEDETGLAQLRPIRHRDEYGHGRLNTTHARTLKYFMWMWLVIFCCLRCITNTMISFYTIIISVWR
jgi:hypothetical protein